MRHKKKVNIPVVYNSSQNIIRGTDTLPIALWDYPKVMVFIPLERSLPYADRTVPALWGIARQGADALFVDTGEVCQTINYGISIFLKEKQMTHFLILDNDHIHPIDIIQRLARWVEKDRSVQVVGGVNFRRSEPFDPAIFWKDNEVPDKYYTKEYDEIDWEAGLIEVDAIGAGCLLIAREVFEKLEQPYWEWGYSKVEKTNGRSPSPDVIFSEKCRNIGVKLYADTTTTSPHLTKYAVDKRVYQKYCNESLIKEA